MVLAFCGQPFIYKNIGRTGIGFGAAANADRHKRIGFLYPCCHNPAWPVIFETTSDKANTIGKQRGGQSIACTRLIRPAIEGKIYRRAVLVSRWTAHGNISGPDARTAVI